MSPRMLQGCTLVLLLAMTLAMAAGLAAWGPVTISAQDLAALGEQHLGAASLMMPVIAGIPLLAVSAWGLYAAHQNRTHLDTRRPWIAFFSLSSLLSIATTLHHVEPSDAHFAIAHVVAAGALVMLGLAFMAERVDALFGSTPSISTGLAVVVCAAVWWFAGQWATGQGDLRALLFFECLPLLLVPAGALGLDGRQTTSFDWLVSLGLYMLARLAGLAEGLPGGLIDIGVAHATMHLLLAASVGCLAYRASVGLDEVSALASAPIDPDQRITSLNTSA